MGRYVGDGVSTCAFFGYPTAHEDGAERAVRAARDVVEAVAKLNADMLGHERALRSEVRVGIATGPVVVGDMTSGGVMEKDAVAGEAANLWRRGCKGTSPGRTARSCRR